MNEITYNVTFNHETREVEAETVLKAITGFFRGRSVTLTGKLDLKVVDPDGDLIWHIDELDYLISILQGATGFRVQTTVTVTDSNGTDAE